MPTFFFFNDTATTEIYTLSLHDALPIYVAVFDAEIPVRHFPRARAPRLVLRDARPFDSRLHPSSRHMRGCGGRRPRRPGGAQGGPRPAAGGAPGERRGRRGACAGTRALG